jgi:hypothetical protein
MAAIILVDLAPRDKDFLVAHTMIAKDQRQTLELVAVVERVVQDTIVAVMAVNMPQLGQPQAVRVYRLLSQEHQHITPVAAAAV